MRQTTKPLPVSATSMDVKLGLEALSLVGNVNVERTVNGNGYSWTITFTTHRNNLTPLFANGFFLGAVDSPHITSVGQTQAIIPSLKSGISYYTRVRAHNGYGFGSAKVSSPVAKAPVNLVPRPVVHPLVEITSSSELQVQWSTPESDGGEPVTKFAVEWDEWSDFASNGGKPYGYAEIEVTDRTMINDRQLLSVTSTLDDMYGHFVVAYDGQRTDPLPYDVSAVDMKIALESLCTVQSVAVRRNLLQKGHPYVQDGMSQYGFSWDIEFSSMYYPGDQMGYLTVDDTGLRGTNAKAKWGYQYQVQGLTCTDNPDGSLVTLQLYALSVAVPKKC
jgi:hypothetical protein